MLTKEYIEYFNSLKEKDMFLGENSYVVFYELDELEEVNADYQIQDYLPNHILFANNGAGTGYAMNEKGQYFDIDLMSLFPEDVFYIGDTLSNFISYLEIR